MVAMKRLPKYVVEKAPGPHEAMHTKHPQKQAIVFATYVAGILFMQSVRYPQIISSAYSYPSITQPYSRNLLRE